MLRWAPEGAGFSVEEAGKSSPPPPADEKYLRLSSPDPGRCCRREPSRPLGPENNGGEKRGARPFRKREQLPCSEWVNAPSPASPAHAQKEKTGGGQGNFSD